MPPLPLNVFEDRLTTTIDLLQELVVRESPTKDKNAVDELGSYIVGEFTRLGANTRSFSQENFGDHRLAEWGEGPGGILILAHMDTVCPIGTIGRTPWRMEEKSLHGPGVLDMKAGIAMALTAIEALRAENQFPAYRVSLFCTSDEETGSHSSRYLIEEMAQEHDLVLCLEPALPDGSLKTWRKGTGLYKIETHGIEAHAGSSQEDGLNAIVEMASLILKIGPLLEDLPSVTFNVGVIDGGTRSNVIPNLCKIRLDLRALTENEQSKADTAIRSLEPTLPGAKIKIEGGWNRPPMPRSPIMIESFERAKRIGEALGLKLTEGGTGGASDANFVAALGVPVLDGLGAVGNGAHSNREHVLTSSLVDRAALLAALISEWYS